MDPHCTHIEHYSAKIQNHKHETMVTINTDLDNFCLVILPLYSSPIILSVTMLLRDGCGVDKFNEITKSSLSYNKLLQHATPHDAAQCFPLATGNLIIMRPT
jgi:hypothetical protein